MMCTYIHSYMYTSYVHEPEGQMLFRLGNVANLLDVTPSNTLPHPLSLLPILLHVIVYTCTQYIPEIL